jgi:predicted RND superfamily exporter protein
LTPEQALNELTWVSNKKLSHLKELKEFEERTEGYVRSIDGYVKMVGKDKARIEVEFEKYQKVTADKELELSKQLTKLEKLNSIITA